MKEWVFYGGLSALAVFGIVFLFYQSLFFSSLCAAVGAVLLPLSMRKSLLRKKRQEITLEFKNSLYNLSSALRAGRSLESAFETVCSEMDPGSFPRFYPAMQRILAKTRLQRRLEDVLYEYGVETGIDEITSFAQIVSISKRTDGNITGIIENTVRLLQEKIEMQQELEVLLAQKKTEQRIMNVMPFFVVGMLLMMAPDYVRPLYETLQGRLIMTVCMIMAAFSVLIARKIADIPL